MVQDYQPALLSGTRGELPKRTPSYPGTGMQIRMYRCRLTGRPSLGSVTALQTEMARLAEGGRPSDSSDDASRAREGSRSLTVPVFAYLSRRACTGDKRNDVASADNTDASNAVTYGSPRQTAKRKLRGVIPVPSSSGSDERLTSTHVIG